MKGNGVRGGIHVEKKRTITTKFELIRIRNTCQCSKEQISHNVSAPADKGNATVLMNIVDYEKKMQKILEDNTYKASRRDPFSIFRKNKHNKNQIIINRSRFPNTPHPERKLKRHPKLYELPKTVDKPSYLLISSSKVVFDFVMTRGSKYSNIIISHNGKSSILVDIFLLLEIQQKTGNKLYFVFD